MRVPVTPRFAATPMSSSVRLLVKNSGTLLSDFAYGRIHNIQSFRDNAFIFSSLIQVLSRIFVANRSAQQTRNTPEGPYRYLEAVKTTFREAMGFCLSYLVLRAFQRGAIDFFRNFLHVRSGLSAAPTLFNGLFRRMFNAPAYVSSSKGYFPSFFGTLKQIGQEVGHYFRGTQKSLSLKPIDHLFPDVVKNQEIVFNPARYKKLSSLVEVVNRVTFSDMKASPAQKLKVFFDWVPVLLGSIPTILLSGLWLERFSQTKAEPLAKKIANFMQPVSAQQKPAQVIDVEPPQLSNSDAPLGALDPSDSVAYANNAPVPVIQTPVASFQYGPAFRTGFPYPPALWAWGQRYLSRR